MEDGEWRDEPEALRFPEGEHPDHNSKIAGFAEGEQRE